MDALHDQQQEGHVRVMGQQHVSKPVDAPGQG